MNPLTRRALGLALVCCGLLMMEVCLTKIFSIVLWYHFGFLAVSTALLGFASSGVYLSLRGRVTAGPQADASISKAAAVAAVTAVASLWLVTQTTFDVYSLIQDRTVGTLLAFVLWVTLPFFFLGLVISQTLAAFPERVNILYGSDLIGSAAGCGLAVLVLSLGYSGQTAILLAAVLVGLGGILFAGRRPRAQLRSLAGLAVPLLALIALDPASAFPLRSPASKPYYRIESIDAELRASKMQSWRRGRVTLKDGSTLDVETTSPPTLTADGMSVDALTDDGPRTIALADIAEKPEGDGLMFEEAPWSPFRRWSSLSRVDAFHWPAAYGAWGLWGISDRYRQDGVQLPRQKGITIDAWAMTSIMRYSGEPLSPAGDPAVDAERQKLKILEYLPAGTVHRVKPDIDHIVCIGAGGGLDLITAKYFGAKKITGVEINPDVVRAVREGFPDFAGNLYDPARNPDIDVHVAEGRHFLERTSDKFDVVQLSGVDTFSTTQAGAFSLAENYLYTVEAFETFIRHLNDGGILTLTRWFYPNLRDDGVLELRSSLRLLGLARTALADGAELDPRECVFFLSSKAFTVILIKPDGFTPDELVTLREHCDHYGYEILYTPDAATPQITAGGRDFTNPLQSFMDSDEPDAFLAAQAFDVTPSVDDRPFFFEVSRFEHVFDVDYLINPLGGLTAHGILVLLFVEVLLLGLVFVILPLSRLRRLDTAPGASRVRLGALLYFTAIGFGFIVVEIVLSQKFVLFLGHPIYALVVILFSVLLFSGIGALLSKRFPFPRFACLLVAVLALAPAFLFQDVFQSCLHFPLWARVAVSVGMMAPVALAMGVPFPVGIGLLGETRPGLIPWAWGINGYTSVLGSVMAVMLGIELGFMTTIGIAAGVYCLGVIGYSMMKLGSATGEEWGVGQKVEAPDPGEPVPADF